MANPHHIVIIGGGAGGLELATRLGDTLGRRAQARITLVDKNRTHIWKPKLHEIAAGSMDMGDHEVDYMAQRTGTTSPFDWASCATSIAPKKPWRCHLTWTKLVKRSPRCKALPTTPWWCALAA